MSRTLSIPLGELSWRFSRSGGPGGQHANKASTKAEVRFDVEGSPSLGPRQRARLLEKLGKEVSCVAEDERSQARNRALALERLSDRISDALRIDPVRVATKPTRASRTRRVDEKRKRGDVKRQRSASRRNPDE